MLWHSVNPCFDIQNWTSSYRDQKSTIKRCKWKVSCDWLRAGHVITILVSDWLKGVDVNCSLIFKTNPTDRGMCCTFNALAAEKIYRDSQVTMMMLLRMMIMMTLSSPGAWRVCRSRMCLTPSSIPHRSPRASTQTRSRRQRQVNIVKILYLQVTKNNCTPGKNRGLTLIIDAHSDIISPSSVRDDFEGFLALVNDPLKFPALFEKVEFPELWY